MLRKPIPFFLIILLLTTNTRMDYAQDSTFRILKFISGSGGVMFSQAPQYFHYATAGENIIGNTQNQNFSVRSGFWNYPLFGPSEANEKQLKIKPTVFQLHQNYPNPFNPYTLIKYDLPKPSSVTLEIFNILGERIKTLVNSEIESAGYKQVLWDGRNEFGNEISSGIYFFRIEVKPEDKYEIYWQSIKKMIFIK